MFIKATYTADGIAFNSYARAWDYLWAEKYPAIILMDKKGNIVHSCELAEIFIVDNQEQANFVEELLWNTRKENISYEDNVNIKRGALIIRDYYDDYVICNKKEVKKKHSEINDVLVGSYASRSALRRYYQI